MVAGGHNDGPARGWTYRTDPKQEEVRGRDGMLGLV